MCLVAESVGGDVAAAVVRSVPGELQGGTGGLFQPRSVWRDRGTWGGGGVRGSGRGVGGGERGGEKGEGGAECVCM